MPAPFVDDILSKYNVSYVRILCLMHCTKRKQDRCLQDQHTDHSIMNETKRFLSEPITDQELRHTKISTVP